MSSETEAQLGLDRKKTQSSHEDEKNHHFEEQITVTHQLDECEDETYEGLDVWVPFPVPLSKRRYNPRSHRRSKPFPPDPFAIEESHQLTFRSAGETAIYEYAINLMNLLMIEPSLLAARLARLLGRPTYTLDSRPGLHLDPNCLAYVNCFL